MRNILAVSFLICSILSSAQWDSNSYEHSASNNSTSNNKSKNTSFFSSGNDHVSSVDANTSTERIGNPDAVPINGYIPFLMIIAGGLIISYGCSKKSIL